MRVNVHQQLENLKWLVESGLITADMKGTNHKINIGMIINNNNINNNNNNNNNNDDDDDNDGEVKCPSLLLPTSSTLKSKAASF